MDHANPLNRRQLLRLAAVGAGAALLPAAITSAQPATTMPTRPGEAEPPRAKPAGAFRVAHLTDTHVQPERGAAEGLAACLRHMQENYAPDLILAGGDNIFDAFGQKRERAATLFELWNSIIASECKTPIIIGLGNHDIWGWNKTKSGTTGDEEGWGKAWAVKNYGLPGRYYSVDRGGWHIVMLDSVQPDPENADGYIAQLDDEQFAWLEADLATVGGQTPVMISSHIPILSTTPLLAGKSDSEPSTGEQTPSWDVSRGGMHVDARRLKELFKQHPNVKLAISGHIHMCDRVDYLGVAYLNNVAVSGSWWKGAVQEFTNGYTLLDLNPDGSFIHGSVSYGWTARA